MMCCARTDLPAGTVTFLFTDVEGSTRLLHELGAEPYAEALADHRQVVSSLVDLHRGRPRPVREDLLAAGRARDAAGLVGSAAALREEVAFTLESWATDEREETLASLASALGDDAMTAALAEGRDTTIDEVVAPALETSAERDEAGVVEP